MSRIELKTGIDSSQTVTDPRGKAGVLFMVLI